MRARTVLPLLPLLVGLADPAAAASGGPDRYGYTWADQDEPGVVTAIPPTTGPGVVIPVATHDSVSAPVALGFSFPFYGTSYDRFVLSANGWLSLDTSVVDSHPTSQPIPSSDPPDALVAWHWRDLGDSGAPGQFVMYPIQGGKMIRGQTTEPGIDVQVEVWICLFDSGVIRVIYALAGGPAAVSLGIESPAGDDGLNPLYRSRGEDGFELGNGAVLEYAPPPALACAAATAVGCGTRLSSASPASVPVNVTAYGCRPGTAYSGRERVLDLTVTTLSEVTLTLSGVPPGRDLDLFLLRRGACNEFHCQAWGDSSVRVPLLSPGTYRVVVDGRTAADDGTFDLAVDCLSRSIRIACPAPGAPPFRGATAGASSWDVYPCTNQYLNGPEVVYELPFAPPGNIKATLTAAPGTELDLLLFGPDVFDPPGGCGAWGDAAITRYGPAPGTYYLMIDGRDATGQANAGSYELAIDCAPRLDCLAPRGDLACMATTTGTTASGASRATDYACTTEAQAGPEVVYRFRNDVRRTVSFLLDGPPDLSLFLVPAADCNEGACIEYGKGSLVAADLDAGDYLLVVDSPAGPGGAFTITPVCRSEVTPASISVELPAGATVHETKDLLANADPSKADILFAIDTTASMTSLMPEIKNTAAAIVGELAAAFQDVQFGVVSFEDYPDSYYECGYDGTYGLDGSAPYRLLLSISNDLAALEATIRDLLPGPGRDDPESYLRVLHEAYADAESIGWRPDARKLLVIFGDDRPHVCDLAPCVAAGGSTGIDPGRDGVALTADDLDMAAVQAELLRQGITPIFIDAAVGAVVNEWTCWNAWGGGDAYHGWLGSMPPDLVPDLKLAIEQDSVLCTVLEPRASPSSFDSWLTNVVPPALSVRLPARARFDFDLGPPPGTAPGVYRFTVDMVCDGEVLASQQVEVTVVPCAAPSGRIGNNLMVTRNRSDLVLDWTAGALDVRSYNRHRVEGKADLRSPRLDPPAGTVTGTETYTETDGVTAPPTLVFHDVWGRDCSGQSIFR